MELEELKKFLRVDGDYDDSIIQMQYRAAKAYLKKAGAKITEEDDEDTKSLYSLAIGMLVGYWYENRTTVITGTISKELEHSITSMIMQLR